MNPQVRPEQHAQNPEFTYKPAIQLSDELLLAVESAPMGKSDTYGATPYDKIATLSSQQDVLADLQKYVRVIPEDIPMYLASYVQDTFNARFWNRLSANDENFTTALAYRDVDGIDTRLTDMIDRGRTGDASPTELLLIRDQLGIRSLELACLTHPYGEKIHNYLAPMQESVRSAVEILGGQYDTTPTPRYGVKEFVEGADGKPLGILMTRKRDFGVLDDGTVIRERSSFVLRVDDASMLHQLLGDDAITKLVAIESLPKDEQQHALEEFNEIISDFLVMDEFSQAIPIATTTYAFNRETAEKVSAAQAESHPKMLDDVYMKPGVQEDDIVARRALLDRVTAMHQKQVASSVIEKAKYSYINKLN